MNLEPCVACRRHVAVAEPTCPFCNEPLGLTSSRPTTFARMSRAAIFAGAAFATTACGDKPTPDTDHGTTTEQPRTAPDQALDAQPGASPDAHVDPDAQVVTSPDAQVDPDAQTAAPPDARARPRRRDAGIKPIKPPDDRTRIKNPYGAPSARRRVV